MANTLPVSGRSTRVAAPRALAAVLLATLTIAGCGSGVTTVSVRSHAASAPASTSGAAQQRTTKPGSTGDGASGAASQSNRKSGAQTNASPNRTAPSPAFTHLQASNENLGGAVEVLRQHGYTATNPTIYHANQTLRVLVGTRSVSADGHNQQAFFFEDGRYLGTDTSEPSASLEVVSQADTEVTLAYPLYRPHDLLCCPTGGHADVRFQLDNGTLQALDPIPPVDSSSVNSRR